MISTEIYRWCSQNEFFYLDVDGSTGKKYAVSFESKSGWLCSCPAYKFSKSKTCKHIEKAAVLKCNHGWEAAAGSPSDDWVGPDYLCPECGGETSCVRVAV